MSALRIAAIIPARMASSRFPGKPLLAVNGLPMIEHVRRRTALCAGFSEVIVATCDQAIAEVVKAYGGICVMTSPEHPAASDRVAEAMAQRDCTHVVNVQGDEILVLPHDLQRMASAIEAAPEVPAWNAVARIETREELGDPSVVKCVLSGSGRVLYCARDFSALGVRREEGYEPVRRVLGILGYRREFLQRYGELPRTPLERAGSIDQNRILEHDVLLQAIEFTRGYPGINEPREVAVVEQLLRSDASQQGVLQEILR
ncbi:MAG: 3-deoxy-manno-octulosonate cytidylyltransferase [Candidatus Omnitrophica bacterium]|nr:3-deoxy-manno-octulosonate cytidylyltransferase [Candidatus Omnitrophota bacterium]